MAKKKNGLSPKDAARSEALNGASLALHNALAISDVFCFADKISEEVDDRTMETLAWHLNTLLREAKSFIDSPDAWGREERRIASTLKAETTE